MLLVMGRNTACPLIGVRLPLRKARGRAEALYVCVDTVLFSNRVRISMLAIGAHLPTVHGNRESVAAGGLMSYGPSFPDLFRRAGDLVDKILRGAKAGDIPVE
jgi:putative ABC transport system substrate-binding protein